jgi:hypothetical protein
MGDEERDVRTDFLFARPSFWSGVGRLLDLWGKFDDYNVSRSAEEADMRALYSDWRITGQDLRDSWILFHKEEAERSPKEKDGSFVCCLCSKKLGVPPPRAADAPAVTAYRYSWKKEHGRQ